MSFETSLAEDPNALAENAVMEFVSTTDQAFAESVTGIQHARDKLEVRSRHPPAPGGQPDAKREQQDLVAQLNSAQDEWNSRFTEHIRPLFERAIAHELEEFDHRLHSLQTSAATWEQYEVAAKQEVTTARAHASAGLTPARAGSWKGSRACSPRPSSIARRCCSGPRDGAVRACRWAERGGGSVKQ